MGADRLQQRDAARPHPLTGRELRALRKLQRDQVPKSPFVFISERQVPFTNRAFQKLGERAGRKAELDFKAHPHMLRHACSYKLSNQGVASETGIYGRSGGNGWFFCRPGELRWQQRLKRQGSAMKTATSVAARG